MSPGHFAYEYVALGVYAYSVWCDEAPWFLAFRYVAQLGQVVTLGIHDSDTGTETRSLVIGAYGHSQFTHIDLLVTVGVDEQAAWASHILPLGLEFAGLIEDLNALVFSVSHINPTIFVGADVVCDVELTLSGT